MRNFIHDFGYNLGRCMPVVFLISVIVMIFYVLISSANACEDTGGTYVRGVFGFECLGGEDE